MRRSVFGAYVQELLREAIARQDGADNLYLVADEATAIRRANGGYLLETANGRSYPIDAAVLALGNLPEAQEQRCPAMSAIPGRPPPRHRSSRAVPVVVLGTGLTMVDVCLALTEQGFEGPIHAISRRGLLPLGHAPSTPWDELGPRRAATAARLLALFRAVRREVRRAGGNAVGWRAVIDAVRPHAQTLWAELSTGRQGALRAPCPAVVGRPPPSHGAAGRRHAGALARVGRGADPCRPDRRDRARRRTVLQRPLAAEGRRRRTADRSRSG